MRLTVLVQLFAAATGGLLLLAPGSAGLQPNKNSPGQERNLMAHQPGSIQGQKKMGGCKIPGQEDPFALNPATKNRTSGPPPANEKLPVAIQVDTNSNRLLTTRIGVGVQVYDYDRTSRRWVFREPQANLYDIETGFQRGIHFAGPYWTDADGGRVKAKASGEVEAPSGSERNIKWLRLEAVEKFGSNNTAFGQVTFIQRVLTNGGQPPSKGEPAEGCETLSVPYTTLYVFWAKKEQ